MFFLLFLGGFNDDFMSILRRFMGFKGKGPLRKLDMLLSPFS